MRVLFCTWVDPDDPARRGGGLTVYQRNLIGALAERSGVETAVLTSGLAHGLRRGKPRVVTRAPGRHVLVDSGVLAPSHADFASPAQTDHPATEAALSAFLRQTGPWDVIHINTLEGMPAGFLRLKHDHPRTRFVLSLHNYYPVCPQVNLWQRESHACTDFASGAACATCLPVPPNPRAIRLAYAVEGSLGAGSTLFERGIRPLMGLGWRLLRRVLGRRAAPAPTDPGAPFAQRRAHMVALINDHADAVLCVSDRVREIAEGFGLTRLQTLRIGSPEAEAWTRTQPHDSFLRADGTLHLAFLGYMRRDKGFFFLMQALAALPDALAIRLHLTIAARKGPPEAMALLDALRPRLAGLRHVDGYDHASLDALLADVGLGVVPVLWEDNLPQVALEMHARHIPLLTSDMGGAKELGRCAALTFAAGDATAFAARVQSVLERRITPQDYWQNARPPVSMAQHVEALLQVYAGDQP